MNATEWIKREAEVYKREAKKLERRKDFLDTCALWSDVKDIDWNCYWSHFYHTDCTSKEAFNNSIDHSLLIDNTINEMKDLWHEAKTKERED